MTFKTPAGEAAFTASYNAGLAQWPVPYTVLWVPTSFGSTHVIACGPARDALRPCDPRR